MSAIEFTYKGRSPSPFGYVDTWEWSAPEAIVNVGGTDTHVTDIRAVRTHERADSYCEPIVGMTRDEVTLTMDVFDLFHDALLRGDSVLAIDNNRTTLHVREVVVTGGEDKPTEARVALSGRIYERCENVVTPACLLFAEPITALFTSATVESE